jgi:hypothetical protein
MSDLRSPSRAGSRQCGTDQGHGEQPMVALPDDFGFSEWQFDDLGLDAGLDNLLLPFDEAAVGVIDYFSFSSSTNNHQLSAMAQPFESSQFGNAGGMQQQAQSGVGDDSIDPALLDQQPQPSQPTDPTLQSTPGLTAVPGAVSLMPSLPMQPVRVENMYPDPSDAVFAQPYAFPPGYQPQFYGPMPSTQLVAQGHVVPSAKLNKRARSESDSESDVPAKKTRRSTQPVMNESEDESDGIVVTKNRASQCKRPRRESRDSGVSSSSSLGKPNRDKVARVGQKPQKCEDKPWVRINTNTKGETTRTARINGEAAQIRKYKSKPLPHGDWESRKYTFEYTTHNGLDEFKTKRMSPRQIMEYIMQYPSDDLVLWLQVSPADMARRYGSPNHSKCLFRDCPKHVYGDSGTIDVGHYRIAFDEKFTKYGNKVVDPFDCPGFVHLYCLERFCNFEAICRDANLRVDTRVDLPREVSQAKWTMSGRPETNLAQFFIKACRKDKLRETDEFKSYPVHQSSSMSKAFDCTLAHALAEINIQNRTRSQVRQFVDRKMTPNVFMISKGDMEIAMTQKKIKRSKVYKKAARAGRASDFDFAAYYDEYDPIINIRIAEYKALKAELDAQDSTGRMARKSKAKYTTAVSRRKYIAVHNSDSGSEPDFNDHGDSDMEDISNYSHVAAQAPGPRSSPRKRARVNYALDAPIQQQQQHEPLTTIPQQSLPSIAPPTAPQGPYIAQGYGPPQVSRQTSLSSLFPRDVTLNIDDFIPTPTPTDAPLTQTEVDDLLLKYYLERRKSSTLSQGPGIIKSAQRSPRAGGVRQASFHVQPVSQSKEFEKDDPPMHVASPSVSLVQGTSRRRSLRLASRGSV